MRSCRIDEGKASADAPFVQLAALSRAVLGIEIPGRRGGPVRRADSILLALAFLAAFPAFAQPPVPAQGSSQAGIQQALMPGLVLDADRSLGIARQPNGNIGAFGLADGRVLWSRQDSFEPLILAGDRLAVREDDVSDPRRFRIAWLDPKTGRLTDPASAWIDLPDWVSVAPRRGRSFAATASLADGRLVVRWRAGGWHSGGANPTSEVVDRERRFARGSALVDPVRGTATPLDATRDVAGKAADAEGANRGLTFGIEPWSVNGREYRIQVDDPGGRHEIFLVRRPSAKRGHEERWLLGTLNDQVVASPDRRALVVFHPAREGRPGCTLWRTEEPGVLRELECASAPISGTWLGSDAYLVLKTIDAGKAIAVVRAIALASGSTRFEKQIHSPAPLPMPR